MVRGQIYLDKSGLIRLLGIEEVDSRNRDDHRLRFTPRWNQHNAAVDAVHCAILLALAEGASWLAVGGEGPAGTPLPVPTESTQRFLRAGKMGGGEIIATPTVLKRGRHQCVVEANVRQDGNHIAVVHTTFAMLPSR